MMAIGLFLTLAACSSGPLTASLNVWCRDNGTDLRRAPEVTLAERLSGRIKDCGPMLKLRLDSYTGAP